VDVVQVRRRVGMVFQIEPFSKDHFDNVAYGCTSTVIYSRSEITSRVKKVLEDAAL